MKHVFRGVPAGSSYYPPPHHRAVKNMKMNKLAALFIIAIIISPNLTIVRGQTLTLAPFDGDYEPGDDVTISGTATAEANLTLLIVFNSTNLHEANFTAEGGRELHGGVRDPRERNGRGLHGHCLRRERVGERRLYRGQR